MNFDQIVESARLRMRKPSNVDAPKLFQTYTSDPRVTKYTTWKAHASVTETESFLDYCLQKWEEGSEYNFVIESKENVEIVGMFKVQPKETSAHIGYVFAHDSWGKGLATEAATAMIHFIFSNTKITTIEAFCDEENKASEKVMLKAGMKFVQKLPSFIVHPNVSGEKRDCLLYRISKEGEPSTLK